MYGLPTRVLMEHAGRGIAEWIVRHRTTLVGRRPGPWRVLVVAGGGHNGGDGLVAARWLKNLMDDEPAAESGGGGGNRVAVMLVADEAKIAPDTAAQFVPLRAMGVAMRRWTAGLALDDLSERPLEAEAGEAGMVVVDALTGTGLKQGLREPARSAAEAINAWRGQAGRGGGGAGAMRRVVVSVDVPSGLDADTGQVAGDRAAVAVRADATLALMGLKSGLVRLEAQPWVGRLEVVDIGMPRAVMAKHGTLGTRDRPRMIEPVPRSRSRREVAGRKGE